jgi:glutamine synthetase
VINTKTGRNLFSNEDGSESAAFFNFIGGMQKHVPNALVMFAPYVNSYRRLTQAASAPVNNKWGYDNRTTAFRVPRSDPAGRRVENRIPSSDANPYLALAASLASGLDGIAKKIEPPEAFAGDVYAAKTLPRVPYTLAEAARLFESSEFAKRAFGEDVVEHYAHFFRTEVAAYDKAVTDWELKRYFERI